MRDDGPGDDGTREAVLEAAGSDARVRYHRNAARLGMPGNLNAGIQDSLGCYIAVCHDHDLYDGSFLEKMVRALEVNPAALFVHCGIDVVSQDGRHLATQIGHWPDCTPGREWLAHMLRSLACPVCALTLVRREAHERWGLYDPSFGFVADVEMWMRLSLHGDVAYIGESLIRVREREANHFATASALRIIRTTALIHHRYIPHVYPGLGGVLRKWRLAVQVERRILVERLSRFVRYCVPQSLRGMEKAS